MRYGLDRSLHELKDEIGRMSGMVEESLDKTIIALQQPLAKDLRLIGSILKIITDLERIAD